MFFSRYIYLPKNYKLWFFALLTQLLFTVTAFAATYNVTYGNSSSKLSLLEEKALSASPDTYVKLVKNKILDQGGVYAAPSGSGIRFYFNYPSHSLNSYSQVVMYIFERGGSSSIGNSALVTMNNSGGTVSQYLSADFDGEYRIKVVVIKDTATNGFLLKSNGYVNIDEVPVLNSGVAISDISGGFNLQWNAASGPVTDYELYRSTSSGSLGSRIYSGNSRSHNDTNVSHENTYYYTAKACNNSTCTAGTQDHKTYIVSRPSFSSGVEISDISGGFNLQWNQASGSVTRYELYRSTSSGTLGARIYSGNSRSRNDTNVSYNTTYYYTAKACNEAGCTQGSQDFKKYMDVAPTASGLSAMSNSSGIVNGSFTVSHASGQVSYLKIHYANNSAYNNSRSVYINNTSGIQSTGSKNFTFDASDWAGQTVYYKLEAWNADKTVQLTPFPSGAVVISTISVPTISIQTSPAISGNTLTASVNTADDIDITRASFSIFNSAKTKLDIQNSVAVSSPASTSYNSDSSARSWGYNPNSNNLTTNWNINTSGLAGGSYFISFYVANSSGNIQDTGYTSFTKSSVELPSIVDTVQIIDGVIDGVEYHYSVELSGPLPTGYGVFLNFDDQQGGWFIQNTLGGHMEMPDKNGNVYSKTYSMNKPGLRSVRAGIFNLKGDDDPTNDELVVGYSASATCTLSSCLEAIVRDKGYGNPALSGSGSELFKNVDVANGNYHLAITDMVTSGKGPSFAMTRAYNSLSTASQPWSFAYEMKATYESGTYSREIAIGPREDGRMQNYFKDMDGLWYALNPGNFDKLVQETDDSFTLYTQGNRLYRFRDPSGSQAGRLQSIKDRLGNALTFNYSGNNLIGATDANSRIYTITRDSSNRIKRVTDFASRYVEYSYDANSMITSVLNMRGYSHGYAYTGTTGDNRYRLKTVKDPRNINQVTIAYDASGRVSQLTDGANKVTGFSYGMSNSQPATLVTQPSVDSLNHNLGFILDKDRRQVIERLDAQNYKSQQSYKLLTTRKLIAEQGLVNRIVEPNNVTSNKGTDITFSNDGNGNPQKITDAKGRETDISYTTVANQTNLSPITSIKQPGVATITRLQNLTPLGKPKTIIDNRDFTSTRMYDANEWLTRATNARLYSTNYQYDTKGNVTHITDAKSSVVTRTYDSLGRLKTELSPLGLTTTYTYDDHGNIKTRNESASGINYTSQYFYDASDNLSYMIDPRNLRTDYVYDNLNRKIQESYSVDGVQHTKNYVYDAMGRMASVTNERNKTASTHYTSRNRVKYRVNPLTDTSVTYTYDKSGNVKTVTDAEGRALTTTYDELNRKTRIQDAKGNYESWTYNSAGQIATYRNKRGKINTYEYDNAGNLTKLTDANNAVTRTTYDGNGNVLTVKDPNLHTTTYTYDELDRPITRELHNGQTWHYSYDANGNMLSETTPSGEKIVKVYDALNRVTQLTERDANNTITRQISYTYDANSNVLSETQGANSITYTYDAINRVNSVTDSFGQVVAYGYDKVGNRTTLTYPGNKTISYSYDGADRLASLTDWLSNTTSYTRNKAGQVTQAILGNGAKAQYSYDNAGRLTLLENLKANGAVISSHNMVLDGAGNITNATVTLPLTPSLPPSTGTMSYDNNNRLLTTTGRSFSHDLPGRIVEQTTEQGQSGVTTSYNFDVNNQLTSIIQGNTTLSSYGYDLNNNRIKQTQNGTETRYVIDQLASLPNVVAETNNQGVISNYYVYGEGLVSQIDSSGNSHYYHFDPTGHTLALTNSSSTVTDKYAYAPYGYTTSEGSTHNPFKYVGRYGVMDDGNGLHYMRLRYYKEDIKRFMSLDALMGNMESPQSLNRYAYVQGNPVMGIDPSGLCIDKIVDMNSKEITGEHYYTELDVRGCIDNSESFKGGSVGTTLKATALDYDAELFDKINISGNVSVKKEASLDAFYLNDGNQTKIQLGAGACVSANADAGWDVYGVRLKTNVGGTAGACVGGGVSKYSDDSYTGINLNGQLAVLVGLEGDVDIAISNENLEAISDKKDAVNNYFKGYGAYVYRCGFFGGKCKGSIK